MAGGVALYRVVTADSVRLGVGADTDRTYEFRLDSLAPNLPMVVTFLLVSTRDLTLRIELNGAVVSDRDYTDGAERTVHEIATDVPVAGNARYTMTFTVLRGDVELSDVVLWFQT